MPTRWQSIEAVPTHTSEGTARQAMAVTLEDVNHMFDEAAVAPTNSMATHCHTLPTSTNQASQPRSIWDSPAPLFSNTPTRNCNPREEGSDTTVDPTFNNKMDEMLLASHVNVKDLWRKK